MAVSLASISSLTWFIFMLLMQFPIIDEYTNTAKILACVGFGSFIFFLFYNYLDNLKYKYEILKRLSK